MKVEDVIAIEHVLKLYVNGKFFDTLYCSGQDVKFLVIGHLFVHKMIAEHNQISKIWQNGDVIEVETKPEELNLSRFDRTKYFEFYANTILNFMREFQTKSVAFQKTGAIHAVALCDGSRIHLFSEDISRNNALEILIGKVLIEEFPVHDKMILLTCRITKQIAQSLAMINVPLIVTKSAVSHAAIDICKQNNIGLIGFARNDSLNYYHYPMVKNVDA